METRPYPNQHACRLRNPNDFQKDSFRTTTRKHKGKEYSVIMGKLKKKDSMTEQAYRYNKKTWTAEQAKNHCKDHDGSFEAAGESDSENNDIERRMFTVDDLEIRADDNESKISGYAAKFNKVTDLGWYKEKIAKGAFTDALKSSDVRCLKNHDRNLILGRSTNGTLELDENNIGLKFTNIMPNTTIGRDTLEEIKRGDISGCSFAFTIEKQSWEEFDDGALPIRTIEKIRQLYDVGPVTYPAYQDTTIAARSFDSIHEEKNSEEKETVIVWNEDDLEKNIDEEIEKLSDENQEVEKEPEYISLEKKHEINMKYKQLLRTQEYLKEKINESKQSDDC